MIHESSVWHISPELLSNHSSLTPLTDKEPGRYLCEFPSHSIFQLSYTWLRNEKIPSRREEKQADANGGEKQTCFANVVIWLLFLGHFRAWWDKLWTGCFKIWEKHSAFGKNWQNREMFVHVCFVFVNPSCQPWQLRGFWVLWYCCF